LMSLGRFEVFDTGKAKLLLHYLPSYTFYNI